MQAELPMFPAPAHDHAACVQAIVAAGERVCAAQSVRLTTGRRRILEIVAGRHGAIGAYQIIDTLAASGRRPAPMTVYRALAFLIDHGLVHRLASRNAFVACRHPGRTHAAQFLMCRGCGVVGEIADDGLAAALVARAEGEGFAAQAPQIEIEGLCRHCEGAPRRTDPAPHPPGASAR